MQGPEEQLGFPEMTPSDDGAPWREHTAERWLRDDPDGYAHCMELIRSGVTNKSRLADEFKRSRNTVNALMMREFSVEQLTDIIARAAAITTAEAISKTDELLDRATVKDLGSVAMALKVANDVKQLSSGQPTEIRETRVTLSVDDFQAIAQTGLTTGKLPTIPPGPIYDLPDDLSNGQPLTEQPPSPVKSMVQASLLLLFMPLSQAFQTGEGGVSRANPAEPVSTSHHQKI